MTSIVVQLQVDGQHRFPDAPAEVEFLSYPHRHMFHVRVEVEVFHNNRDIEIIMLKHAIQQYFQETYPKLHNRSRTYDMGTSSCESMAEELIYFLHGYYRDDSNEHGISRAMSVQILEDGENGAIIRETK